MMKFQADSEHRHQEFMVSVLGKLGTFFLLKTNLTETVETSRALFLLHFLNSMEHGKTQCIYFIGNSFC